VALKHGLEVLDKCIGLVPKIGRGGAIGGGAGGAYSPKKERAEELLRHYKDNGDLPDLEEFATRHGLVITTIQSQVVDLIEDGDLPSSILEDSVVQEWLSQHLSDAIKLCWIGEAEGKLKPLMVHLESNAPEGLNYAQLKIALWKLGTD
jgi:hypothetical protein